MDDAKKNFDLLSNGEIYLKDTLKYLTNPTIVLTVIISDDGSSCSGYFKNKYTINIYRYF